MYTWRNWRSTPNIRQLENIREKTSYAIQSQYSASPKMLALAEACGSALSPEEDVTLFYEKIFNIHTAQGPGLDNWGRILRMERVIRDESGGAAITLDDDNYRLLLLYKAMANISAATAAAQNALLAALINTGIAGFPSAAYVLQPAPMLIRWVFEKPLTFTQLAVFKCAGSLTRGAGVGWEVYAVEPSRVFGFSGSHMQPFGQSPFAADNALSVGQ